MWLFRALADRLKALFVADVASDLEAQFLVRNAERKADLLRQAQKFEDEGLKSVARQVRQQAENLSIQRPLESVMPALGHWQATETLLLPAQDKPAVAMLSAPHPPNTNKRKGR